MGDKKNAYKFTIQFNSADPHHSRVIDILNAQGRRKAQFIVNAVLHYVSCTKQPEDIIDSKTDYGVIESIVKKILEQYNLNNDKDEPKEMEQACMKTENKFDNHTNENVIDSIEDNALREIITSVDIFRR